MNWPNFVHFKQKRQIRTKILPWPTQWIERTLQLSAIIGILSKKDFTSVSVKDSCESPHGITGPTDQTSRNSGNKLRLTTPPTRPNFVVSPQKVCIQNDVRAILQWSKKLYILACKRDPMVRDRDETEMFGNYVSRPSRDRDVETETTSLQNDTNIAQISLSVSALLTGVQTKRRPTKMPSFIMVCPSVWPQFTCVTN